MTLSEKTTAAIDAALQFLGLNKLRSAYEDVNAYYFTGCGNNGETIYAEVTCRVDKATLECSIDKTPPTEFAKKKAIIMPKEREDVLIPWSVEVQLKQDKING